MIQPFNVGYGTRRGRMVRLCLAALMHPAGVLTRHLCRRMLVRKLFRRPNMKCGLLFRWGSCWIGAHWSSANKRLYINLIPFVTIWIVGEDGVVP